MTALLPLAVTVAEAINGVFIKLTCDAFRFNNQVPRVGRRRPEVNSWRARGDGASVPPQLALRPIDPWRPNRPKAFDFGHKVETVWPPLGTVNVHSEAPK